jgi:hypothetical protein
MRHGPRLYWKDMARLTRGTPTLDKQGLQSVPTFRMDDIDQVVLTCLGMPDHFDTLLISVGSALDGEDLPAAWDPFQGVLASILEFNPRASNQVLHGGRHQYLARGGQG